MALPKLKSADGRVTRVVSTRAELDLYESRGYKRVRAAAEPKTEQKTEPKTEQK